VIDELGRVLPGLAMESRTVGSPQIRNRATVGGNLGSGSPAGDTHPVLLACDAEVELGSVRGTRRVPIAEFYTGVRQTAVEADELITSVFLDAATGPQQFSKIGPRNAMVIAVCCLGLALHSDRHRAGVAIGSAAPTPRHAGDAEEFLAAELPWGTASPLGDKLPRRFGELVAAAAEPIDDVRGSADYRRHALLVLARRALGWAWHDYREGSYQECA
jgi:CO/xanthine dehydrogenase FAD-binding subunit